MNKKAKLLLTKTEDYKLHFVSQVYNKKQINNKNKLEERFPFN
jgi:hypothetical protein